MIKKKSLYFQKLYKRQRKYVLTHGMPKKFQKHGVTQTRWRMKLKALSREVPYMSYRYLTHGYMEDLASGIDCWVVGALYKENLYWKGDAK